MYALYKLSQMPLRPEFWIAGLLLAAWWLARNPLRLRAVRRLIGAALAVFWLGGSTGVTDPLLAPLRDEAQFARPVLPEPADAIVVLSGGRQASQQRVVRAIRLWRAGVAPVMVMSGGIGQPFGGTLPEAVEMRDFALSLGVPVTAIAVESRSRTTSENASETRRLIPAARRIVVVSSFLHLRRSAALFRREGFEVSAVASEPPVDPGLSYEDFLPSASALGNLRDAIHEYVGIAVYRALGRLDPPGAARTGGTAARPVPEVPVTAPAPR